MFVFGWFSKSKTNTSTPRVLTDLQFTSGDVRIGDLVPVVGGCPRFVDDTPRVTNGHCILIGGHDSVVRSYKGELYYVVIT